MRRLRPYIAVAIVAVALCADRAVQAAPMLRPEVAQLAERWVARLTIGFSRSGVNPRIAPQQRRQAGPIVPLAFAPRSADEVRASQPILSPIQFCLPPPLAA